jgi:hypothetical protein
MVKVGRRLGGGKDLRRSPQSPPTPPTQSQATCTLFRHEEERLRETHRLGNLWLLARRKNAQAQNFGFNEISGYTPGEAERLHSR